MSATLLKPPNVESAPSAAARKPDPSKGPRATAPRRASPRLGGTRRLRYMTSWSRQVFVLIHSGTPLAQAMGAVEAQADSKIWRDVLHDLRQQIDGGLSLSEAMAAHPHCFDPVCRSLIAAGESSGQLDAMLDRIASLSRQQLRVRRSLIGAMIYPALLILVALGVLAAMLGFVLPRFAQLFETLDVPLPPTTIMLLWISSALQSTWWMVLGGAIGAVVGARAILSHPAGRRSFDAGLLRIPGLAKVAKNLATARMSRLLGSLLRSRVGLLEALQLTRDSTGNRLYAELIDEAAEAVAEGRSMSAVLARSPLISPSLAEAVKHGEQSGQVATMLVEMADFMDEDNEAVVKALTSIFEPVILIALGAMVAFIALSLFVPLFDLTSMT